MTTTITEEFTLSDYEFGQFSDLMHKNAAVSLAKGRKFLVICRLQNRLRQLKMSRFQEYLDYICDKSNQVELRTAVDLLTTHETYFFREPQHFDYLTTAILPRLRNRPIRVWSAASSTGEEAYSIAMVLKTQLRADIQWEVLGTDVSVDAVNKARRGRYPADRLELMPSAYLRCYIQRGVGAESNTVQVTQDIRSHVSFQQHNLADPLGLIGSFDVIFLRNVLIYFNDATRAAVMQQICQQLRPGGYLVMGHADVMCKVANGLKAETSTIFRKPE